MISPKEWLINYCNETIKNTKYRCLKHRQACKRTLDLLEREDIYFDEEQADNVVKFFALLRHSKGVLSGKPIVLDGLSKFIAYCIYGFKFVETDYRVYRKAFISMGRKGQKSQLQSGFALYEMSVMATKWNTMNYCTCAGTSRKQSKVIFEECQLMLRGSILAPKFKITRDEIIHRKTLSRLEALSREAKKDGEGTNVQLAILDEYKDMTDTMFYEIAETGQRALPQPLLIIISTAGNNINCPMYTQEYPYATRLLNGEIENDRYFTVICEVENGDDIDDWRVWEKANQLLFTYKEGIEGLKDGYKVAKEIPEKMNTFLVKNLNMWQSNNGVNSYMNMDKFRQNSVAKPPIDLRGKQCFIGVDISAKIDLTSVTFMFPYYEDNVLKQYFESYSFCPNEERVAFHERNDKMPFKAWQNMGYIISTESPIVDQNFIIDFIENKIKEYGISKATFAVDPSNASLFSTTLTDKGYDVFEIYFSFKHQNEPVTAFREQLLEGRICYLYNPCLEWQFTNAKVVTNNDGYIKIDKSSSKERIDAVDSCICAFKLAMYFKKTIDLNKKILADDFVM